MRIRILMISLLFLGCSSFPQKDRHPEVPYLKDILNDKTKFERIIEETGSHRLSFLKDDRILIIPYIGQYSEGPAPFRIVDLDNRNIFEMIYKEGTPLYFDMEGNMYYDYKKYLHPDYNRFFKFDVVMVNDSIRNQFDVLEKQYHDNDTLLLELKDRYELEFLGRYGITPCEYSMLTNKCDVYEVKNDKLIIRQNELFKNDFSKKTDSIPEFDVPVLTRYAKGGGEFGLPFPVFIRYYIVENKYKFKEENYPYPEMIVLKGKLYLNSTRYGLYLVK